VETAADLDDSAALLAHYQTYIVKIMPHLDDEKKDKLRKLLGRDGTPTIWGSLEGIERSKEGRTWEWSLRDDGLFQVCRDEFDITWKHMAAFMFIGMRPSQCQRRYESMQGDGAAGGL
jgi:hypothetical protein